MRYEQLSRYLDAREKGGHGWIMEYEREINGDGNWPWLAGHYEDLLSDILSLVPNSLLREAIAWKAALSEAEGGTDGE